MDIPLSPQFSKLWRLEVVTLIWAIWTERNACTFDGKKANYRQILASVKSALMEISSSFRLGVCSNSWADFLRGRRLGVACSFAPPCEIISISWWPPLISWIKVNTDGAASGSPGQIGACGVFRDAAGHVRGCFLVDGGRGFAFEAELLAAITAISISFEKDWCNLWLETDSTYVAHMLSSKSNNVPWRYANSWRRVLNIVEGMDFRVSHIYREGNQVADLMVNLSTPAGWWSYGIPLIF